MTWSADQQSRTIEGVTCRIEREGTRWRYQASLTVGATLLCADGRCASEQEARDLCERLAMGLVRVMA
jgi:hypothetical protein